MIKSISVKGYKTLHDCKLTLGKRNILIGGNMSGKSNIIEILQLVGKYFIHPTYIMEDASLIARSTSRNNSEISILLESEFDSINTSLNLQWDINYQQNNKNEPVKLEAYQYDSVTKAVIRELFYGYFKPLYSPILCYKDIHTNSQSPIRQPQSAAPFKYLNNVGSNLANILLKYFNDDSFRSELKKIMKAVNPDFMNIYVDQVVGNFINITWKEKNLERDLYASDLSDGTLRLLCLCAILLPNSIVEPPKLICIDEPELGLYPRRVLPILAEMIKNKSEESQVIITTHSPELLNYFDLEDVVALEREDGKTKFIRPSDKKELEQLLKSYEYSLSDLWLTGKFEEKS
ncbi:MAG: AAA family ATPase [Chloroherpetonaceae bacterium]|nr:AAA family ATPase [Chloroherpetonaceae bacterium]